MYPSWGQQTSSWRRWWWWSGAVALYRRHRSQTHLSSPSSAKKRVLVCVNKNQREQLQQAESQQMFPFSFSALSFFSKKKKPFPRFIIGISTSLHKTKKMVVYVLQRGKQQQSGKKRGEVKVFPFGAQEGIKGGNHLNERDRESQKGRLFHREKSEQSPEEPKKANTLLFFRFPFKKGGKE